LANTKSAIKAIRVSERRRLRNKPVRTAARSFVARAKKVIEKGGAEAVEAVRQAASVLDKAAQKGVIHKRTAARRKSRLMKKLHANQVGQK